MRSLRNFAMSAMMLSFLAGCSITSEEPHRPVSTQIDKPIYLRGVFTWWDAEPQYQMKQVPGKPGVWMTQAQLVADGHPYEWKVGDKDWQCGTDFGYLSDSSPVQLNQPRVADNCAEFNSFSFTPDQDGIYQFYLDVSGQNPQVYIRRASSAK
ncbi:hypothetical protein [Celerinatantimonas sp. YJH-8]|uniref:hypothetical protein n=1 Tax=Celerinatantimonas sp. YJH-8 TaxID=3228714 RepID=UPI0038C7FE61